MYTLKVGSMMENETPKDGVSLDAIGWWNERRRAEESGRNRFWCDGR